MLKIQPFLQPPLLDILAFAWFFICWVGFTWLADASNHMKDSLIGRISTYRLLWMYRIAQRDNRMMDTAIIGTLQSSVSFFASTSIFIIAGLIAILGTEESVIKLMKNLPFVVKTTSLLFEIKIFLLIIIFVYAFFKLTWALRQLNYTAILIGALPLVGTNPIEIQKHCEKLETLSSMSGKHFNRGIRAYYFGLAVLSWFIHPYLFMALSLWTVLVLYRREFLSKLVRLLEPPAQTPPFLSASNPIKSSSASSSNP